MPSDTLAKQLFKEISKSCDKYGLKKTVTILKTANSKSDFKLKSDKICTLIAKKVCREFDVSLECLMQGRSLHERTQALHVCYYLFKEILGLDIDEIVQWFKKSRPSIYPGIRHIKHIKQSAKLVPDEKSLLLKINTIEAYITEFIEKPTINE